MRVALDTNAYADWKKGTHWLNELSTATEILVPITTYAELRYGFACGNKERANLSDLDDFLSSKLVTLCEVNARTAEQYAYLKVFLRQQGTPLPENDIWIAACAVEHGAQLLTRDQHFKKLPQVRVKFES